MSAEQPSLNFTVVDCLGRERAPDKLYPDGSWNCPFCWAAVVAGTPEHTERKCPNPSCTARGGSYGPFPVELAREMLAEADRREAERREREERAEWSRSYQTKRDAEEAARRQAATAEAQKRGACVPCALESVRYGREPKFTKHRAHCPKTVARAGAF